MLAGSLACALALAAAPARAADSGWPACEARSVPIRIGAREVSSERVDPRLVSIRLRSRATGDVQPLDVLLPRGYSPKRSYPVLYLLHGAGEGYSSWLDQYPIRRLTSGMRLIVVMPQGSGTDSAGRTVNGGYSDWFGLSPGSPDAVPAWESYDIRELVPFIDRRFGTVGGPAGRAVAGISMGGGGAFRYAAQHPGTFGYAGSLSGELEPTWPAAQAFQPKNCKYGDPASEEVFWRDNDPTVLARNLRGVRLFVRSGDGSPGPYDPSGPPDDPLEAAVAQVRTLVEIGAHQMATDFLAAAEREGVTRVNAGFYAGTHQRAYWNDQLPHLFAWLGRQLDDPVRVRRDFRVASAHSDFTAWRWRFSIDRRVREFLDVRVRGDRLRARGSGRLHVTTPSRYVPGAVHLVAVDGHRLDVVADARGRLAFDVSIGPSHRHQQTDFGPGAMSGWDSVRARIGRRIG